MQPAAAASAEPAPESLTASLLGAPDVTGAALGKPAIASIQAGLRQLGYETGPVDGVLGPRTNAAVKAFQEDEGLVTDGKLTASTRARLARRISGE
jgi:peptidoglycan hydrolase-like protein with peptidoglycan-binding domain